MEKQVLFWISTVKVRNEIGQVTTVIFLAKCCITYFLDHKLTFTLLKSPPDLVILTSSLA
jgi:hypothetical protein